MKLRHLWLKFWIANAYTNKESVEVLYGFRYATFGAVFVSW